MYPERDRVRTWLTRGSILAGIAYTATAEYELAGALGASPSVAVMLPLALDLYVVAALRWFRSADIALSLSLMGAAQIAAHLLEARVMAVTVPMVVVVSLLVPVAIWRTHALARPVPGAPVVPAVPEPGVPAPARVRPAPAPRVRTRAVLAAPAVGTPDPLTARVRTEYTDANGYPSVRELKARYSIGQARAQRIRDALATV